MSNFAEKAAIILKRKGRTQGFRIREKCFYFGSGFNINDELIVKRLAKSFSFYTHVPLYRVFYLCWFGGLKFIWDIETPTRAKNITWLLLTLLLNLTGCAHLKSIDWTITFDSDWSFNDRCDKNFVMKWIFIFICIEPYSWEHFCQKRWLTNFSNTIS